MDYIYPRAKEDAAEPDAIDTTACAADIIAEVEAGEKDKIVVCSKVLKGLNAWGAISALYDEIEAETKAMAAVPVAGTQTAYVAELDKVKAHLDSAKYLAGKKAEAGVTTWTDLVAKTAVVAEL